MGASVLGASMGPDALRIAGIARALRARGLEVIDRGNLPGPGNPQEQPASGFRHLPEVTAWNESVFAAVLADLRAGRLPLLMGGDHCLAIGSISAVAQHCRETGRRLKVLWFDAHADANTPASTPSGNLHGMPVACLLGHGRRASPRWPAPPPCSRARSARWACAAWTTAKSSSSGSTASRCSTCAPSTSWACAR